MNEQELIFFEKFFKTLEESEVSSQVYRETRKAVLLGALGVSEDQIKQFDEQIKQLND